MLVPIRATIAPPTTTPAAVPARPRTTLWPVLSAFERSTESVPSTTQNECWTPDMLATSTARLSPAAPRRLLWSQTECGSKCATARCWKADTVPGRPEGRRPSIRLQPAAPVGGGGDLGILGDLGRRERELLRPEARVERRHDRGGAVVVRRQVGHGGGLDAAQPVAKPGERLGQARRIGRPAFEQVGCAVENIRRRRLDRTHAPVRVRPGRSDRGLRDDRVEPRDLVDETNDRPRRRAQPGRPVRGREERPLERRGRRGGALDRFVVSEPLGLPAREEVLGVRADLRGECPAGGDRGSSEPVRRRRRPEQPDREQRGRGSRPPAGEALRDRRGGSGDRDGQDERQQQGDRRAREHRADDAREEDPERHDRRHGDCRPRRARGERAHAHEACAREPECRLRPEPRAHRAAEVDQEQHRERAERGEDGEVRVPDHLLADRKRRRHHDRPPAGPPQCSQVRIATQDPGADSGERADHSRTSIRARPPHLEDRCLRLAIFGNQCSSTQADDRDRNPSESAVERRGRLQVDRATLLRDDDRRRRDGGGGRRAVEAQGAGRPPARGVRDLGRDAPRSRLACAPEGAAPGRRAAPLPRAARRVRV